MACDRSSAPPCGRRRRKRHRRRSASRTLATTSSRTATPGGLLAHRTKQVQRMAASAPEHTAAGRPARSGRRMRRPTRADSRRCARPPVACRRSNARPRGRARRGTRVGGHRRGAVEAGHCMSVCSYSAPPRNHTLQTDLLVLYHRPRRARDGTGHVYSDDERPRQGLLRAVNKHRPLCPHWPARPEPARRGHGVGPAG